MWKFESLFCLKNVLYLRVLQPQLCVVCTAEKLVLYASRNFLFMKNSRSKHLLLQQKLRHREEFHPKVGQQNENVVSCLGLISLGLFLMLRKEKAKQGKQIVNVACLLYT